jgi:hypothetical protein
LLRQRQVRGQERERQEQKDAKEKPHSPVCFGLGRPIP